MATYDLGNLAQTAQTIINEYNLNINILDLPDWCGRKIAPYVLASVVGYYTTKTVFSMVFDEPEIKKTTEPRCFELLGFKIFCWDRTCYLKSCSVWNSFINNCMPETYCTFD